MLVRVVFSCLTSLVEPYTRTRSFKIQPRNTTLARLLSLTRYIFPFSLSLSLSLSLSISLSLSFFLSVTSSLFLTTSTLFLSFSLFSLSFYLHFPLSFFLSFFSLLLSLSLSAQYLSINPNFYKTQISRRTTKIQAYMISSPTSKLIKLSNFYLYIHFCVS